MNRLRQFASAGFTLIELMVGLAIAGVLLVLVGPSFIDIIDMQRLRGTSAQLVTDVQYARSEAISRQEPVAVSFGSSLGMTCYVVHTCGGVNPAVCSCNCTAGEGGRCSGSLKELRTVQVPQESLIEIRPVVNPATPAIPPAPVNFILFDPMTGGMQAYNVGVGSTAFNPMGAAWSKTSLVRRDPKTLRTMISVGGRPSVCTPSGELVSGAPVCP